MNNNMVRFLLPSLSSNSPSFNHFHTPIPTMSCKSFCDQTPYGQKSCFNVCKMWPETILPHPVLPPPPPPRPRPFSTLHRDTIPGKTLLLLTIAITASTIFGFFMVCILFKRLLRYHNSRDLIRRNRATLFDFQENSPDDDGGEGPVMGNHFWYINTIGFQQSVIDSITMFQYKKDERLIDGTECSVCLGDFEENESLRLLPKCNHAFHVPCIDTWLRSHKNCPVCRAPIMSNIAASQDGETQMEIPEEGNSILSRNNEVNEEGISGVRRVSEIPMKEFSWTSSDLSENRHGQDGEVKQTIRRSVSLDSVSASVIHKEMKNIETPNEASSSSGNGKAKNLNSKNIEKKGMGNQSLLNLVKSTSFGRGSMKRINSSGKKVFSYSHSRSQSSVLPL